MSLQVHVAFILAGCTHATYYKTLQHALGIKAVNERVFMRTIELMYPVVKAMLDEVCEIAKQEMKEKREDELGSWKHAVTTADGTWQIRGWHSKNATFTISILPVDINLHAFLSSSCECDTCGKPFCRF